MFTSNRAIFVSRNPVNDYVWRKQKHQRNKIVRIWLVLQKRNKHAQLLTSLANTPTWQEETGLLTKQANSAFSILVFSLAGQRRVFVSIFSSHWQRTQNKKQTWKSFFNAKWKLLYLLHLLVFAWPCYYLLMINLREGVLSKVLSGEAPPQGLTPYPFIYHLWQKRDPFCIPSIDKWLPFHMPSLELWMPLNPVSSLSFKYE